MAESVSWEKFGLTLKINALFANAQYVRLNLSSESSSLDPTLSKDLLPGIQINALQTQIDAPLNQSLILSGLLKNENKKTTAGFPFLKTLPILGPLFSSQDYIHHRSELILILIPYQGSLRPSIPYLRPHADPAAAAGERGHLQYRVAQRSSRPGRPVQLLGFQGRRCQPDIAGCP